MSLKNKADELCTYCGKINFFCQCGKCEKCGEDELNCRCREYEDDDRYKGLDFFDQYYNDHL